MKCWQARRRREETKKSTKSKQRSTDDINTCVENELESVENENDAEL